MPGLNGVEVAKLIKKTHYLAGLAIIIMCTTKQRQSITTSSVDGFLIKPIKTTQLITLLMSYTAVARPLVGPTAVPQNREMKLNVLVCEDNPMNQKIIKSMVERLHHNCDVCADGLQALEEFSKKTFDIIFMDCRMPILDGFETTKRIREKERNSDCAVQIIALTADVEYGVREKCLQVGMDDYLSKPIKKSSIEEILQNLMEKKSKTLPKPKKRGSGEQGIGDLLNVLLVEDNVVNARIASVILKKHNFQVTVAHNGKMALDMIIANHGMNSLILMDMYMPGMDGQTATQLIRSFEADHEFLNIPIIALTGDKSVGYRESCLSVGCNEYMTKPVDYPLLISLVKKFVGDYNARRSYHKQK